MSTIELLAVAATPLGILTYALLLTTATLGLLFARRRMHVLPAHKLVAKITVTVATLHGAAILFVQLQ